MSNFRLWVIMRSGFDASYGRSGSNQGSTWVGLLVLGMMMIAGSIFGFSISDSKYDTEETSFFYESDREDVSLQGLCDLLYDMAVISEGGKLENPSRFSQTVAEMMTRALDG